MPVFWLKMKIQLPGRSYLEDQTLLIQLTKKLAMQSLVSFSSRAIQLPSFLKSKSEALQSPPYIFFHFSLFYLIF